MHGTHACTQAYTQTHTLGCMMIPVCWGGCVWGWVLGNSSPVNLEVGGAAFGIPFLCLGLFLNGSHAVLPDLVLMSLFCTPGQTCDGCEMYLVLCGCMIYTYKTRHEYIHSLYITFPYV